MVGAGLGKELLAKARAEEAGDETTGSVSLDSSASADSPPINPTFPMYRTRGDVLYWVQYYYRHPEADLLKLAVESLLKERMKPEDGWLMAGLVAGIMKNRPESLSHFAVHDIYNVLQDFRQALLVGLWLGGSHGKEHLQKLVDEVTDEATKQTINNLLTTPPPDPLLAEMDIVNANMNLHVLLGVFYATGDTAVVDKMIDLCRDWSVEVLTKGGREGAARFYVAKTVREKLALLCQEHEVAREACRRALATPQGAALGEGLIPALTNEQRTMLRNILEVVDRLEAEDKTQHNARKQRLDASIERAFRKEGSETK